MPPPSLPSLPQAGKVELAELLLGHGAQAEHENKRGMTPFLEAADAGNVALLKLLHQHGADVHKVTSNGDGALELAKWARDSDEISEWLKGLGVKPQETEHHDDEHAYRAHEYD